jgi:cytochrome c551
MRRKRFVLAILPAFLLLSACGAGGDKSDSSDTNHSTAGNAEDLYQESCIGCHGQNLEGAAGPNLQKVGAKYSEGQIEEIINKGRGNNMPGGLVNEKEAEALAKWLSEKK